MALLSDLKVTVIIKDEILNTLQEFNSCADFTIEKIHQWKSANKHMTLDTDKFRALPRKSYPLKNFIEQTLFSDYRKWLKNIGTITQELQEAQGPSLDSGIGKRSREVELSFRDNIE